MPYKNIVWVKLYLDLFDDDRFLYKLSERQQLLYLKLLVLAGITRNSVPGNAGFIRNRTNYQENDSCLDEDLSKIVEVYPKFKRRRDGSYYFEKFNELVLYSMFNRSIYKSHI